MTEISKRKRIITLFISAIAVVIFTYLAGQCWRLKNNGMAIGLNWLCLVILAMIALIAMRITRIRIDWDIKNDMQYIVGIVAAISLSIIFSVIPALLGLKSICGTRMSFSYGDLFYYLFHYLVLVGPVEELIFRVYLQETIVSFFSKNKWISVLITSMIFGLWHIINGNWAQVFWTAIIGTFFGFCKYLIKDCKYISISLCHGLYDFLLVLVRMFIV